MTFSSANIEVNGLLSGAEFVSSAVGYGEVDGVIANLISIAGS